MPPHRHAYRPLERIGSILIIDDEADVRELVADVLAGLGHRVTVAGGGREVAGRYRLAPTARTRELGLSIESRCGRTFSR